MWTRSELKNRAKACLKQYYWMAFLVMFLVGLLGGGERVSAVGTGSQVIQEQRSMGGMSERYTDRIDNFNPGGTALVGVVTMVVLTIVIIFWIAMLAFKIFVGNPVCVGGKRFFMESRTVMRSAGVGKIFYAFGSGSYLNVVKTMFMKNLFVFLWTLLLIVPGIIKSYQYYMVPYILSENPDMNYKEALQLSSDMMHGNKWKTFVLELSFSGWFILGALLCGIGVLFVNPYVEATYAELYAVLRMNAGTVGLRGFGGEEAEVYEQVVSEQ